MVFSVKSSTRIAGGLGDRNELLANDLAGIVGMAGSSVARRIEVAENLGFPDIRSAIAIRWGLPNSRPVSECQASIVQAREAFLRQLGNWAVFTATIGATDRGPQNVVWDVASGTLAHVDFEDSFRATDNFQEQVQLAKAFGGLNGAAWRQDSSDPLGQVLACGILDGNTLLVSKRTEVLQQMRDRGVEPGYIDRSAAWIDLPTSEKLSLAAQSVG
ncbi:MAG TPA: hypothetical protein VGV89_07040 [Thermoplasmata archaeon]|nr:hypothetical protein [Thermoplasmata archaeon]